MSKRIWKYTMPYPHERHVFSIPAGAAFRSARLWQQYEGYAPQIDIWFEVDDEQPKEIVRIQIVGTGQVVLGKASEYLATVFDDMYVWHLYRVKE